MTTGFNLNVQSQPTQPQVERSYKNGKMYETQRENGRITAVTVFKDFNGDGEIKENEIELVHRYDYEDNGKYNVSTYVDDDGDGTLDRIRKQKYDKSGEKIGAPVWKDIKDKCCSAHSNMQNIRWNSANVFHKAPWDKEEQSNWNILG